MGLVLVGIVFRVVLQHQLSLTKFTSQASDMSKHATTLALSVPGMDNINDAEILTDAIQETLCVVWVAVTITCSIVFFITSMTVFATSVQNWRKASKPRPLPLV